MLASEEAGSSERGRPDAAVWAPRAALLGTRTVTAELSEMRLLTRVECWLTSCCIIERDGLSASAAVRSDAVSAAANDKMPARQQNDLLSSSMMRMGSSEIE